MNINLEKAKEQFIKYTERYNLDKERLKRKQLHSLRVMKISKQIAEGLQLSQEEIEVAELIGLLHDIARFEQLTKYNTFKDIESVDHGDLGEEILNKDIRKYIEINKYDEIIIKSVKNHNKYKIEEELTEKQKLFAKIVRDADKIDIFYQAVEMFWKDNESKVEESILSEVIAKQFLDLKQIKSSKDESEVDNVIKVIAFIFDINFKSTFEILKKEDYITKIFNRYNFKDEYTKQKTKQIQQIANQYINQKEKIW